MSSPSIPSKTEKVLHCYRGQANLSNCTTICGIEHIDSVAYQGQSRVFTPFSLAFGNWFKDGTLESFGGSEAVITHCQSKSGNLIVAECPVNQIYLITDAIC